MTIEPSGVAGSARLATPLHQPDGGTIAGPLIVAMFVVFVLLVVTVELLDRRTARRDRGVLNDLKKKPYRNPDRVRRLAKSGRLRRDLRT